MLPFVIVTGFFDIGRDKWNSFRRTPENYYYYILNFMQIRAPLIFFTEERFIPMFSVIRKTLPEPTVFVPMTLENLPASKYFKDFAELSSDKRYLEMHPNPQAPEVCQPLYNIVTNSKIDLMYFSSKLVEAEIYIWIDAGYTHGKKDLKNFFYYPSSLFKFKDKVSIIQLKELSFANPNPIEFFKQYIDILAGGFFAMGREIIEKVREKYFALLEQILKDFRIKDDDQYYWTLLYFKEPELFNLIKGDWYSGLEVK
jgi:hypothetical protein